MNTNTIRARRRAPRTPNLISTDADRAAVLAVVNADRYHGRPLLDVANRAGLSLDRATDALHDLLAMREIKHEFGLYCPMRGAKV